MNHKSLTYTLEHRLRLNRKRSNSPIINSLVLLIGLLGLCAPNQSEAATRAFRPYITSVCNRSVSESTLLACNIYHESRGEFYKTKFKAGVSVGLVTLNRARATNKTIKQVILEPNQFSWTLGDKRIKIRNQYDKQSWLESKKIAKLVLQLKNAPEGVYSYADITNGALYYHEKHSKPKWRKDMTKTAKIGSHVFYKTTTIDY